MESINASRRPTPDYVHPSRSLRKIPGKICFGYDGTTTRSGVLLIVEERLDLSSDLGKFFLDMGSLVEKLGRDARFGGELVATVIDDIGVVGLATSVPGKQVGGVGCNVRERVLSGDSDHVSLEFLGLDLSDRIGRVVGRLKGDQVCHQATNMWGCHGCSGDSVSGIFAADPGGENVETGSEDVSTLFPLAFE